MTRLRPAVLLWAAVVAGKLWLVAGFRLTPNGLLTIDDRWFVARASDLAAGDWLGQFEAHTLIKQPGYPMFIAAAHRAGTPLLLAEQVLYLVACVLTVVSLRPALGSGRGAFVAFAVLAWNPMTMNAPVAARVDRSGIYPALTLLLLAGLVGLARTARLPGTATVAWAGLTSAALAALWLVREEWLLVVPAFLLGLGLAAVGAGRSPRRWPVRVAVVALIMATPLPLAVSRAWLSHTNDSHYGSAVANTEQTALTDAVAALQRTHPGPAVDRFPMTVEARALAYTASPTFASLRDAIEGPDGSRFASPRPDGLADLGGAVFMWVVLDAVETVHRPATAAELDRTLHAIASEVDAACDAGTLPCRPRGTTFLAPFEWRRSGALGGRTVLAAKELLTLAEFSAVPPPGNGSDADRALFARMTGEPLAPGPPGGGV